jgi:acetyl esterase/lipase
VTSPRFHLALPLCGLLAMSCGSSAATAPQASAAATRATRSAGTCAGATDESDLIPGTTSAPACAASLYTVTTNIAYAAGPSHLLDLYLPRTGSAPHPTVIWIHGGGWQGGDKANAEQPRRLVCQGYAVASINYRLSGEARFPAQIHDVKAAIRQLRASAGRYGLDPQRFATFGSSAGGHLAALAATSSGVADLEDLSLGNPTTSSAVQAAVDWYGPTDLTQMDALALAQGCRTSGHGIAGSPESLLLGCVVSDPGCAAAARRASPLTYVTAAAPPILILHGSNDCTVAHGQSLLLRDALRAGGACASMRTLLGAGHGGPEWLTAAPQDQVADFLDVALAAR